MTRSVPFEPGWSGPRAVRPQPPPPPTPPDPWAAPLLVPIVIGCAIAVLLGAYAHLHKPTGFAINFAGFSSGQYVKAWLASTAAVLAIVQMISALISSGKITVGSSGGWVDPLHRWSGRLAVLFTVPVVVHCVYALGFGFGTARILAHSVLGCLFYGCFVTKMLALSKPGVPSRVMPVLGALVFSTVVGVVLTSSLWLFSTKGLHF